MPLHMGLVCLRCSDGVLANVCLRCSDGFSLRSRVLALFPFALAFEFSPVTLPLVPFATCGPAADDRGSERSCSPDAGPFYHGWYEKEGNLELRL